MEEPRVSLKEAYKYAKEYVIKSGYSNEINWQENINFNDVQESDFLRESAWVILSSGMKETIIRKYFNNISYCFLSWKSASRIVEMRKHCYESAIEYFNHHGKISAIIDISSYICEVGFCDFKKALNRKPLEILQTLPFIGPVTSYHLAKNIGLPVAKVDRHLVRLSKLFDYNDVQEFCTEISKESGDKISVVDIVMWRFATLKRNYEEYFSNWFLNNKTP